jgi:hypothetical protein
MAIDALLADMTPEQVLALQLRAIFLPKAHSYILDHFEDVPRQRAAFCSLHICRGGAQDYQEQASLDAKYAMHDGLS